jgi:aryl-alcohol dehydrogenase-like predicted oxidoreductase
MGQPGRIAQESSDAMNRLAIGTVQFGLRYGVANSAGQVTTAAAAEILETAFAAGIDLLDTAVAYGSSEACLGAIGVSRWRVITKLPSLPQGTTNVATWARAEVRGSLERLRLERVDGLLLHRPADLLGPLGSQYRRVLHDLKSEGYIGAAGVSIYDPSELDALWPSWRPDIVQAPYNVLDRRLGSSGWLEKLTAQGVRVHVRSVFLQGLLLMGADSRPEWFSRWSGLLDRWLTWCVANDCSPLAAALAFAQGHPGVECCVVGVDSVAQLRDIFAANATECPPVPGELVSEDRDLIEPGRWRLS